MRALYASILAVALVASSLVPGSTAPADDVQSSPGAATALDLLTTSCLPAERGVREVAQVSPPDGLPVGTPTTSPVPSPGATNVPIPHAGLGPAQLLAPALPTSSPDFTAPPAPTPTPSVAASAGPVFVQRATPLPGGSAAPQASPTPQPVETLGPNQYVVLADTITGSNKPGQPADLDGNVNVIYADGIVVGDHAHYDGTRYIDLTGRPFIRNSANDTTLRADAIRFDTLTSQATLINGRGATTQGVQTGHLYYTAKNLQTESDGHTHGQRASFTTCDRQRAGYHVESKTLDIYPGDKAVAKSNVLYLGGFAVFFIPIIVVPLSQSTQGSTKDSSFLPVIGYSQTAGFYVNARIGFAPSNTYYGYYRLDLATKAGVGIGYVAFFRPRNGKRSLDVNFYRGRSDGTEPEQNNFVINDTENFSHSLRAQFGVNYQGEYGPYVDLPPSDTITASIIHEGAKESQNYTFNEFTQGSESSSLNLGFVDQRKISNAITQGINLSYTENQNSYAGESTAISSLHINTLTNITTRGIDYSLTYDKTDSVQSFSIDKLPELLIRPHGTLDPGFTFLPITLQLAVGEYSQPSESAEEPQLSTARGQAQITIGPAIAHFLGSDLNATATVLQDYYTTGDEKAQIQQNVSFTTALGTHVVNAITYSEENTNGPQAEPFQTFDILGGASKQASDVIRLFNGNVYTLTLQSSTLFSGMAQPWNYQLNYQPSPRASILLGGSWIPGPGQGFYTTNVQVTTPFGRGSDVQFSTNVNWKSKGQLADKNIYYRRIIGDCYELLASYNQDLKQVNFTVEILAFPSYTANFGLQQQQNIVPGSLNFASGTSF